MTPAKHPARLASPVPYAWVTHRLVLLTTHACLDALAGAAALPLLPVLARTRSTRTRRRPGTPSGTRLLLRLGALERARLAHFGVAHIRAPAEGAEGTAARAHTWVVGRVVRGLPAGAGVLALWSSGLALLTFPLYGAASPVSHGVRCLLGVLLLLGGVRLSFALAAWDARDAGRLLGPGEPGATAQRVRELIDSRASVVEAIDAERRRIERDLHDGVQQQLVALALLMGRARRAADTPRGDPSSDPRLVPLLDQAHENALQALDELRDVTWRVYPAILDDRGLDAALSALAGRSAVPVRVDHRLPDRLPPLVEPVAYFAVSEAVTNAAKHSGAELIEVGIGPGGKGAVITVTDDGEGGADPTGPGLSGLTQRIAAVEGEIRVTSPPGGPTEIVVELPCAS